MQSPKLETEVTSRRTRRRGLTRVGTLMTHGNGDESSLESAPNTPNQDEPIRADAGNVMPSRDDIGASGLGKAGTGEVGGSAVGQAVTERKPN